MRWSALFVSLILPGMGHTAIGRPGRGVLVTVAFTTAVVLAVGRGAATAAPMSDAVFLSLALAAAMIHLLCQWSLIRALLPAAIAGVRPAKEDRFRAGLAAAARGDDARAEAEFRRVLLIDPADVEAHLNLGALLARHGRPVEARKLLRRCRRLDLEGKWAWEARQELRALEPAAGPDVAVPLRESGVPNGEADLQGRGR